MYLNFKEEIKRGWRPMRSWTHSIKGVMKRVQKEKADDRNIWRFKYMWEGWMFGRGGMCIRQSFV